MKKIFNILSLAVVLASQSVMAAELPSWGLTENQYKLPTFNNKMAEIGKQAIKNNWQLKVTAPSDWHGTIRDALTKTGEQDVQAIFVDTSFKSVSIAATPGAKIAQISPSTSGSTVQKQVVIDKPDFDTAIEAPEFSRPEFENNTKELLENVAEIDLGVPTGNKTASVKNSEASPASKESNNPQAYSDTAVQKPVNSSLSGNALFSTEDVEQQKELLRKKHARNKRVDRTISYENITSKDDLFISGSVVLVKRFMNRGLVIFYWMKEAYDPTIHNFVEKTGFKYFKENADADGNTAKTGEVIQNEIKPIDLNFVAVDNQEEVKDQLRRDYINNKWVDNSITSKQLKTGDVLYIREQTVLVEREFSKAHSNYYWLIGNTVIEKEVEKKGTDQFVIK